jgi:hypothetical protein
VPRRCLLGASAHFPDAPVCLPGDLERFLGAPEDHPMPQAFKMDIKSAPSGSANARWFLGNEVTSPFVKKPTRKPTLRNPIMDRQASPSTPLSWQHAPIILGTWLVLGNFQLSFRLIVVVGLCRITEIAKNSGLG